MYIQNPSRIGTREDNTDQQYYEIVGVESVFFS